MYSFVWNVSQVVIAAETGGALGGMVRQLSIDQFENEGRRVSYGTPESATAARKLLDRQMSINSVPKKVYLSLITNLLLSAEGAYNCDGGKCFQLAITFWTCDFCTVISLNISASNSVYHGQTQLNNMKTHDWVIKINFY